VLITMPETSTWIDTHTHLLDEAFADDREEVLARARQAGVDDLIIIGTALEDSLAAARFAETHRGIWATAGVHPIYAALHETPQIAACIQDLASSHAVVGLGEIGLDYFHDRAPRATQQRIFAAQLALASDLDLPVVIHCRDAQDDTLAIIDEQRTPALRGVFHCFGGDADDARAVLERGFHISFTGPVTYKSGTRARDAARVVPLDRLMIETDCPYMAPTAQRGRRNEPAFAVYIAEALALLHGISLAELAQRTTLNARTLFAKMTLQHPATRAGAPTSPAHG
jgi:TatD DNase family protein